MDLIKAFTAFTRKVEEFSFSMEKTIDCDGVEVFELSLSTDNGSYYGDTTSCPAEVMKTLMTQAMADCEPAVLKERSKILIVDENN